MTDPVVDPDRLAEIASFDLFSAEVAARLDAFADRLAAMFDMPVALVSVVLDTAQVIVGSHGLYGWAAEVRGTPVEWSFCAEVVRRHALYVLPDAAADALQATNPLVTLDGVGCYAGAPLITSNGHVLGSCCVLGGAPREFTADELATLTAMAQELAAVIEGEHRLQVV
jgi:GAF domain-containing protein